MLYTGVEQLRFKNDKIIKMQQKQRTFFTLSPIRILLHRSCRIWCYEFAGSSPKMRKSHHKTLRHGFDTFHFSYVSFNCLLCARVSPTHCTSCQAIASSYCATFVVVVVAALSIRFGIRCMCRVLH